MAANVNANAIANVQCELTVISKWKQITQDVVPLSILYSDVSCLDWRKKQGKEDRISAKAKEYYHYIV